MKNIMETTESRQDISFETAQYAVCVLHSFCKQDKCSGVCGYMKNGACQLKNMPGLWKLER